MKDQNLSYIKAKNKVEKERGFYTHLLIYILVNLIITGFKMWNHMESWDSFTYKFISIDVLSVWTIWGVFLVLHFLSFKFGMAWEERKIAELMDKELSKDSEK